MMTWSRKASPGHGTWGERNANFFLHFLRRSSSTGRISSRHRFAQPRNQFQSIRKKLDLHTPILMVISERHDKQTEWQLNARGTYRILRILSVIITWRKRHTCMRAHARTHTHTHTHTHTLDAHHPGDDSFTQCRNSDVSWGHQDAGTNTHTHTHTHTHTRTGEGDRGAETEMEISGLRRLRRVWYLDQDDHWESFHCTSSIVIYSRSRIGPCLNHNYRGIVG